MKKRIITRTITTTEVDIFAIDLNTAEPYNTTIVVSGDLSKEKKPNAVIAEVYDNEDRKFLKALGMRVHEDLYALDEQKFLELATKVEKTYQEG